jgi:hypothetical protein
MRVRRCESTECVSALGGASRLRTFVSMAANRGFRNCGLSKSFDADTVFSLTAPKTNGRDIGIAHDRGVSLYGRC